MASENPDVKTILDYKPTPAHERVKEINSRLGWDIHHRMGILFKRLMTMWVEKVNAYGPERYRSHDIEFDAWMNYSGVWRKAIRVEELTRQAARGDEKALKALLDAYADLSLYSMSAVVVLERRLNDVE